MSPNAWTLLANKTWNIASLIPNFRPSDPEWEFPSHFLSVDGNGKMFDPMGIPVGNPVERVGDVDWKFIPTTTLTDSSNLL